MEPLRSRRVPKGYQKAPKRLAGETVSASWPPLGHRSRKRINETPMLGHLLGHFSRRGDMQSARACAIQTHIWHIFPHPFFKPRNYEMAGSCPRSRPGPRRHQGGKGGTRTSHGGTWEEKSGMKDLGRRQLKGGTWGGGAWEEAPRRRHLGGSRWGAGLRQLRQVEKNCSGYQGMRY